jgi:hypothetical protein
MTQTLLKGSPRGLNSYLEVLPFDQGIPIARVAEVAMKTKPFLTSVRPVIASCKVRDEEFLNSFKHAYCLFRRHGIPFWSAAAGGGCHPYFASSPFTQEGAGDIIGMVPIADIAVHSCQPNAVIGFPDGEMVDWLVRSKGIMTAKESGVFVLQALRDIKPGELITVNKNAFYNFEEDVFKAWFGYPFKPPEQREKPMSSGMEEPERV